MRTGWRLRSPRFAAQPFTTGTCSTTSFRTFSRTTTFWQDPSLGAFAGLSYGGFVAGVLLLRHTYELADYGLFSPAPFTMPTIDKVQAAAIRRVRVMVGAGVDDGAYFYELTDVAKLRKAGDRVTTDYVNGGHDWFVWRVQLRDFLSNVAFKSAVR